MPTPMPTHDPDTTHNNCITIEELRVVVNDCLDVRAHLDVETHTEHHLFMQTLMRDAEVRDAHHAFIQAMIEDTKIRAQRWEATKTQIAGSLVLGVISTVGAWVLAHISWDKFIK